MMHAQMFTPLINIICMRPQAAWEKLNAQEAYSCVCAIAIATDCRIHTGSHSIASGQQDRALGLPTTYYVGDLAIRVAMVMRRATFLSGPVRPISEFAPAAACVRSTGARRQTSVYHIP